MKGGRECGICNKHFKFKYDLMLHEKTKEHMEMLHITRSKSLSEIQLDLPKLSLVASGKVTKEKSSPKTRKKSKPRSIKIPQNKKSPVKKTNSPVKTTIIIIEEPQPEEVTIKEEIDHDLPSLFHLEPNSPPPQPQDDDDYDPGPDIISPKRNNNDNKISSSPKKKRSKIHKCSFCSKILPNRSALVVHLRVHTGQKPYECSICQKRFSQNGVLSRHMGSHNEEQDFVSCPVCQKVFRSAYHLKKHSLSHSTSRPHPCTWPSCTLSFKTRNILTVHMRTHTKEKPYSCIVCGEKFAQLGVLNRHKVTHSDVREFSCPHQDCLKTFKWKKALDYHLQTHNPAQSYFCPVCQKSFKTSFGVRTHQRRRHALIKTHCCEICFKFFADQSSLTSHKKTHLAKRPSSTFDCEICGKSLSSLPSFRRHWGLHQGIKPFNCELCDRSFATADQKTKHMAQHVKVSQYKYKCKELECQGVEGSKGFPTIQRLWRHLSRIHGQKPYICGLETSTAVVKKDLMGSVIKNDGDLCGKAFKSPGELRNHQRSHTKEKRGCCPICSKLFANPSNLQIHLRTHSGEKPFTCELCNTNYSCRAALNSHVKRIHTTERPHSCPFDQCDKTFKTKSDVRNHVKSHTKVKEYQCDICFKMYCRQSVLTLHKKRMHSSPTAEEEDQQMEIKQEIYKKREEK